eukprot:scaffold3393_cov101-Isochrysis_galbana.AAC.6
MTPTKVDRHDTLGSHQHPSLHCQAWGHAHTQGAHSCKLCGHGNTCMERGSMPAGWATDALLPHPPTVRTTQNRQLECGVGGGRSRAP